jgi:hypothetical protein
VRKKRRRKSSGFCIANIGDGNILLVFVEIRIIGNGEAVVVEIESGGKRKRDMSR